VSIHHPNEIRLGLIPSRILLACIKFLGKCPCPRCLVTKADIPDMGSQSDMATRLNNTRISNHNLREKVKKGRRLIFKHGASINGVRVKKLLDDESLVPTHVRHPVYHSILSTNLLRMPLPTESPMRNSISFFFWLSTSFTSSN